MSTPAQTPVPTLGVLGSGTGSNFVAIADAIADGRLAARIATVVSDLEGAGILERARVRGLPARAIVPEVSRARLAPEVEATLIAHLQGSGCELVILAGFMRLIGPRLLAAFPGRILNIHPSLLPAFPGLRAWEQALAAGATVTGCTVHIVDAGVDTGPVLAQRSVPILPGDTAGSLHARIQEAEHTLYPEAIGAYLAQLRAQSAA